MVVRQMPKMTPEQYKATVASAPEDHEEMMEEMKHAKEPPAKVAARAGAH